MLGLHRPDGGARRGVLDRNGNAAAQAAAAAGDDDRVEAHPERFRLRHQFEADRSLAGDDGRVVEWRHQDHALFHVRANHRHAIVARPVERNHFGAHFPDIADLHRRRIGGHGDNRLDAEHRRRRGDALRMVARREGDDAAAALLIAERRQLVVGAAELERAGTLQRLRLEQDAAAETLVELWRFDQRRFDDQAGQARCGAVDIGDAGKGRSW